MKKHYFLAVMASVVCGMSVQAQESVQPVQPQKDRLQIERSEIPPFVQKPGSLLRSSTTDQVDSIIRTDRNDVKKYKYLLKYTEDGQTAGISGYKWDAATSSWENEKFYSYAYTYDENGNQIRTVYETVDDGQVSTETTTNSYDDQGRLISAYFVSDSKHSLETYTYGDGNECYYEKRDSTFVDGQFKGWSISQRVHTLDDAGNITKIIYLTFDEWKDDDTKWYQYAGKDITYDSSGRTLTSHYFWMNDEHVVTYTEDITYTYIEESYTYTYEEVITDEDEGETSYYAEKYEVIVGNPVVEIVSYKDAEDDAWTVDFKEFYYYAQSSSVANETIQQHVTPVCKVWSANGALTIAVSEATPVQVYTMSGVCCYDATVHGQATIANLPAGIYIVKCQQETYKVKVK